MLTSNRTSKKTKLNPKLKLTLPKLHAEQTRIVSEARRFNVLACGRRFGKTVLLLDRLIPVLLTGRPCAWFAPNEKLFDEAWRDAVRLLTPVIRHKDQQKKRLELITGGVLEFWTLHNTDDPGRSRKYAAIAIDEAAMASRLERQWLEAIRPTLTDYRGGAWFASTPKGSNYFRTLFERGLSNDPDWISHQLPTSLNPFIQTAELNTAKRELPAIVYQQEYLAEFVDMQGATIKREWLKHAPAPENMTLVMGVDLAISKKTDADYTAAVILGKHADHIHVIHASRTRAGFHGSVDFIRAIAHRYRPAIIAIENVQFQAAVVEQLLRDTNLPIVGIKPDKDKLTRFLPLAVRYEQGLVWHEEDLNEYEDELLSFPVGRHDDLVDAAAYAYNQLSAAGSGPRVRSL
jgi:predicted phage terminase large subunit-like protein